MGNKIIRIVATSDLFTDQRIQRVATTLQNNGFDIVTVVRKSKTHTALPNKTQYRVKRIGTCIKTGPLFYILYNVNIFFHLLTSKYSYIYANDLDVLLGCTLASKLRRKLMIYDSNELFTEIPELIGHKAKKNIWGWVEKRCIKRAKRVITVSNGVAQQLKLRYGVEPVVIRNVPLPYQITGSRSTTPTIIYQGYLNMGRGIELIISTMLYLPNYSLIVAGKGEIENELKALVQQRNLGNRVKFLGRISPEQLRSITASAWLGISLEEDLGLNYRYALPNKLFDYIAAQVPVLVSDLPEMRQIVDSYGVGIIAKSREPQQLAEQIKTFLSDQNLQKATNSNLTNAAHILNWENEKLKLIEVIDEAVSV